MNNRAKIFLNLSTLLVLAQPLGAHQQSDSAPLPPLPRVEIVRHDAITESGAPVAYSTPLVCVALQIYAGIVPASFLDTRGHSTYSIIFQDKSESSPCKAHHIDSRLGLIFLQSEAPADLPQESAPLADCSHLKREDACYLLVNGAIDAQVLAEKIPASHIGTIASLDGVHFPIPLLLVNFQGADTVPELGSPCYTAKGELMGLAMGITANHQALLLPANAIAASLANPQQVRAQLGCTLDPNNPIPEIKRLTKNGLMANAGILPGDIISKIDATPITTYQDFLYHTFFLDASQPANIHVIRGTQVLELLIRATVPAL